MSLFGFKSPAAAGILLGTLISLPLQAVGLINKNTLYNISEYSERVVKKGYPSEKVEPLKPQGLGRLNIVSNFKAEDSLLKIDRRLDSAIARAADSVKLAPKLTPQQITSTLNVFRR